MIVNLLEFQSEEDKQSRHTDTSKHDVPAGFKLERLTSGVSPIKPVKKKSKRARE